MRALRIAGIIAFAVIIGYAANSLYKMYESGSLFDSYNSQRADKVALLAISVLSMGVLACMEVLGSRNVQEYSAFGRKHYQEDRGEVITGTKTACIYTAPKTVDPWQGRRESAARMDYSSKALYDHWLHVVRVLCAILPIAYMVVCADFASCGRRRFPSKEVGAFTGLPAGGGQPGHLSLWHHCRIAAADRAGRRVTGFYYL